APITANPIVRTRKNVPISSVIYFLINYLFVNLKIYELHDVYFSFYQQRSAMISVGQQAPDFTLYDSEKKQVTLSEFRGKKVLLLFFPLAFTSTCTKELCFVRDTI